MPSPKARAEAFVPLPLPPGSAIPPPSTAATSASAHAARQARRWGITDASALPADSPALNGAIGGGSALGADDDEDVVFSRSSPPAGPAVSTGARAGMGAGGFSSRFSSAYAVGASPAASPGLSALSAQPTSTVGTAPTATGSTGAALGAGDALYDPWAPGNSTFAPTDEAADNATADAAAATAVGSGVGAPAGGVISIGSGRRLPADTLTLLSGLDFDSGDSAAAAAASSGDSDTARLRALHALLAMGDMGCFHAIPKELMDDPAAGTRGDYAQDGGAVPRSRDDNDPDRDHNDAGSNEAGSDEQRGAGGVTPALAAAAEAALEEELAPARAAHRSCTHPFTVIIFFVVCFVLPFVLVLPSFQHVLMLFSLCIIMAGSLSAICFRLWLIRPKAALFAAFPAAAASLIFFALTALGLSQTSSPPLMQPIAAIMTACFLMIAASVWAADRLEPTVALLKLTVAVHAANPAATLGSALVMLVLLLWTAPFGLSIITGGSYSFLSAVALYWLAQTTRYLVHATAAGVTTSWYYTRAGSDASPLGLGVGITAPSLTLGSGSRAAPGAGAAGEAWFGGSAIGGTPTSPGDDYYADEAIGDGYDEDDELDMDGRRGTFGHGGSSGTSSGLGTVVGLRGYAPVTATYSTARLASRSSAARAGASDAGGLTSAGASGSSDGTSLTGLEPTVSTARALRRRLTLFASPRCQQRLARITALRAATLQFGAIAFGALFVAPVRGLWLLTRRLARVRCLRNRRVMRSALAAAELLHYHFNRSAFRHVIVYGTDFSTASHITYRTFRTRGVAAVVEADQVETFVALVPVTVGALSAGLFYIYTFTTVFRERYFSINLAAIIVFVCASLIASTVMEAIDAVTATVYACFAECPGVLREADPVLFARFVRLAESAMVRDLGAAAGAGASAGAGAGANPSAAVHMGVIGARA